MIVGAANCRPGVIVALSDTVMRDPRLPGDSPWRWRVAFHYRVHIGENPACGGLCFTWAHAMNVMRVGAHSSVVVARGIGF